MSSARARKQKPIASGCLAIGLVALGWNLQFKSSRAAAEHQPAGAQAEQHHGPGLGDHRERGNAAEASVGRGGGERGAERSAQRAADAGRVREAEQVLSSEKQAHVAAGYNSSVRSALREPTRWQFSGAVDVYLRNRFSTVLRGVERYPSPGTAHSVGERRGPLDRIGGGEDNHGVGVRPAVARTVILHLWSCWFEPLRRTGIAGQWTCGCCIASSVEALNARAANVAPPGLVPE